ncbi:hypothetical protein L218DRAFT_291091 [Marasmius fiardii PR-910]|nr:hypothetical protein L218DRAFT_291091 [Marasmius fiardii PR-910]
MSLRWRKPVFFLSKPFPVPAWSSLHGSPSELLTLRIVPSHFTFHTVTAKMRLTPLREFHSVPVDPRAFMILRRVHSAVDTSHLYRQSIYFDTAVSTK